MVLSDGQISAWRRPYDIRQKMQGSDDFDAGLLLVCIYMPVYLMRSRFVSIGYLLMRRNRCSRVNSQVNIDIAQWNDRYCADLAEFVCRIWIAGRAKFDEQVCEISRRLFASSK
jgi:hypothetical protein